MKTKFLTLFVALIATTALWASNVITYTATSQLSKTTDTYSKGLHTNAFNVAISSHTFSNGTGTITFAGEVTTIGNYAFYQCSGLTSITIPNSVTMIGRYAFYGCRGLTSAVYNANCFAYMPTSYQGGYTIPEGIIQIAGGAFRECSGLTSVTIPNSVTTIGENAFEGCSGLKSVTIGNSVTTIGSYAFFGCSGLIKTNFTGTIADWCGIKFGDELANPMYNSHNFYINDVEVKNLVIPDGVDTIGDYAFSDCSSLTSVTIPNSVTTIGIYAFYGCYGLTSPVYNANCFAYMPTSYQGAYTIPNGIIQIAGSAFSDCYGLKSITIPSSVTSIGEWAFLGCDSLHSVMWNAIHCNDFANNSTPFFYKYGSYIYGSAPQITELVFGDSVQYVPAYLCTGMTNLKTISVHTATPPTCGSNCFSNVSRSIPVYVHARSVDIYKKANEWGYFNNIQGFPEEYAMITCYASNGTIIGGGKLIKGDTCTLTVTPDYGYHFTKWNDGNTDNPRLFVITQDSTFTAHIDIAQSGQCGDNLYWRLVSDTLIIIGSGKMYDYTESHLAEWYLSNRKIAQLVLPDSLTHIGNYAFANCSRLASVTVGNSVTTIGNSAFNGCNGIKSVTWNAKNCSSYNFGSQVETFVFGDSVEVIPANVCQNMAQLTTITIPNSATTIRSSAFSGCNGLATITIPSSVQSVGNSAFKNCTGISELNINDGLTAIGDSAFYGLSNKNLKEISLPNSVETIGKYAFAECSYLKTITLGAKLEDVDEYAFQNDERLIYVNCYAEEPPVLQENAFDNYDIYLQVPCDVLDEYKVAKGWKLFNRENVSCLSAEGKTVTGDDVIVTPSATTAEFIWPSNDKADSYSLEITKDGAVFCTLTFNAQGQLTGIAFAPGRGHTAMAHAATTTGAGWQFTVTGLNQASKYAYTMDVKNASQKSIKTYTGEFVTDGYTDLLPLPYEGKDGIGSVKFIQNGRLLIERNGIRYNAHGARVK